MFGILCCVVFLTIGCFFCFHKTPTVSLVMPVYNRADLVGRAIESILNQTFQDFEFVIVDDGSTDNTRAVLNTWANRDRRIRVIGYSQNKGISYARQYGLENARGEFVAVMDSDDVSFPNRLDVTVRYLRDHPDVMAVSARVVRFNDQSEKTVLTDEKNTDLFYETAYRVEYTGAECSLRMIFNNLFQNTVALFRRDFVKKHNISYNTSLVSAEDYDFWASFILAGGRMTILENSLGFVRKHQTNTSAYYTQMKEASDWITQRLIRRFFEPTESQGRYWPEIWIQCEVLKKIRYLNETEKVFLKQEVDSYYATWCPSNWENGYFLMHSDWNGFFIPEADGIKGQLYPWQTKGQVSFVGKILKIKWNTDYMEYFLKDESASRVWNVVSPEKQVTFFHPKWMGGRDVLLFNLSETQACRLNNGDCADVMRLKDRFILYWNVKKHPVEIFGKNKNGDFVFLTQE